MLTESPANPLPRSRILSYLTTADSPTHIRNFTAHIIRILAILHTLAAAICLLLTTLHAAKTFHILYYGSPPPAPIMRFAHLFPPPPPPSLTDIITEILRREFPVLLLFLILATLATTFFACASPIARGKHIACFTAGIAISPYILLLAIAAVALPANAFNTALGVGPTRSDPTYLLLLIPGALALLLGLSAIDLLRFLTWIADHPNTEKPPVPFLPPRPTLPPKNPLQILPSSSWPSPSS